MNILNSSSNNLFSSLSFSLLSLIWEKKKNGSHIFVCKKRLQSYFPSLSLEDKHFPSDEQDLKIPSRDKHKRQQPQKHNSHFNNYCFDFLIQAMIVLKAVRWDWMASSEEAGTKFWVQFYIIRDTYAKQFLEV